MTLMLLVGIPVFLVFGGALLAFAFAHQTEEPEAASSQLSAAARSNPAPPEARPLVFFQSVGWSASLKEATVEEIVASIEAHLRKERRAAQDLVQPLD